MGLVSATEMLKKAKEGHYAVGQFNINNLEWTKSVLLTAEELKAPVILGVSEGAAKYMTGYTTVAAMVKAMVEALNITVPVALHLDHGSYEGAKAALDAGFSSIMFDGSHYGIEENIEKTKEIVELCHSKGVSVEAEVGSIGGEEDGVIGKGEVADPKECKSIADLGVDFLAAGIGNIHGKYPANWEGLDFDALDAIQAETGKLPLVLHGGSGIPDEMIKKAITLGVSFPAPSSVELQYQPSKCVPPMIEKEEYTFSRLLEIALFCAIEPINQPVTPFGAYSIAF